MNIFKNLKIQSQLILLLSAGILIVFSIVGLYIYNDQKEKIANDIESDIQLNVDYLYGLVQQEINLKSVKNRTIDHTTDMILQQITDANFDQSQLKTELNNKLLSDSLDFALIVYNYLKNRYNKLGKPLIISNNGNVIFYEEDIGKNISHKDFFKDILKNKGNSFYYEKIKLLQNNDLQHFYYRYDQRMQNYIGFTISQDYLNQKLFTFRNIIIIGILLILALVIIIVVLATKPVIMPIKKVSGNVKELSEGKAVNTIAYNYNNEIGDIVHSLNDLIVGLRHTKNFSKSITHGNLDDEFKPLGHNDELGNALLEMQESLKKAEIERENKKEEENKQTWVSSGLAKFADILRNHNNDIEGMSNKVISELVKYMDIQLGGLFLLNDEDENHHYLELKGCYAFDRYKYYKKTIELGEGLIGSCFLEKKTIFMNDLPDGYMDIRSGLGDAEPRSLLIVPLISNETIIGVIELATIKDFKKFEIGFTERICGNIASTIISVKQNLKTSRLLEQFQQQSEELKTQEEEMRQNLEELQAAQEETARREAEMSGMIKALDASVLLAEFDLEGKIININEQYAKIYNQNKQSIIGRTYKELKILNDKEGNNTDVLWNKLKNGSLERTISYIQINENEVWLSQTFSPILDNEGQPYKVLNLAIDITDIKKLEREITKQNDELEEAHRELSEEQALMNAMMKNLPDNIYFKDRECKFLKVSDNMLKLFDAKSMDELYGKSDFDFFSGEHAQQAYDDEQHIMETGEPIIDKIEKETWEDGSVSWVSSTKMPLRDENNNIVGIFGISSNVTHLKNIEIKAQQVTEELHWKNAMFNILMDKSHERIRFKNKEGIYQILSKTEAQTHGFNDPKEMIGKSDIDLFDEGVANKIMEEETNLIENKKSLTNIEERRVLKNGDVAWALTSKYPFFDENGEIMGLFIITQDTTEIKNTEIKLITNEKIIDGVAPKVPILVYYLNKDKNITAIKGGGIDLLGKPADQIIGKPYTEILPDFSSKIQTKAIEKTEFTIETTGTKGNKSWKMKHTIFGDKSNIGALIGYAYLTS
jgi:PAS domain S-box-containing protein